jgi:ATP-dependent DNA helicase RecG
MHAEKFNEKTVVVVDVPEAPIKPTGFKGRCFRRSATSNKPMTPSEIAEMHLFSTGASWDALECDAKIKDIDLSKIKKYVQIANQSGRRNFKEDSQTILKKTELVKKNPTWAGILLFGKEPGRFSIMSPIHCGRFKLDKTEILDDLMIQQDLIAQVDEAMNFLKKHISVKYEFEGTPRRREI